MAYYSGQASSYQELLNVLVNACVEQGWAWNNSILSKENCYLKLTATATGATAGIIATGGTGVSSGSTLLNPALTTPRLGNPGIVNAINFPVAYRIFIFAKEVYLITKFNINSYYYLAFGKSSINLGGNGLWISATACGAGIYSSLTGAISIGSSTGGAGGATTPSAVAPFWNGSQFSNNWSNSVIQHGFDNILWSSGTTKAILVSSLSPLINRMPSNFSQETVLLPINVYVNRLQNKISLACQFEHARFIRIDNFNDEQIITLGGDKWMVFPFYKRDITARDGGNYIDHTGTFGWAIRYDGP